MANIRLDHCIGVNNNRLQELVQMSEIKAVAIGVGAGVVSGLGLGLTFILLLGCQQPEMQLITMVHSVLAMVVMGAWTLPALVRSSGR
jgi:hypothetical protein